jgi:hypothetical protein
LPALLLLVGLLAIGGQERVWATTGPSTPTPARYKVSLKLAQPFRGQYSLVSASQGARLGSGAMAIDLNSLGYLFGIAQFHGYDAQGHQTTWLAGLYNFHTVDHGQMLIMMYDTSDTVVLGRMSVTRRADGGLTGRIVLGRQSYAIRWRKNLSL